MYLKLIRSVLKETVITGDAENVIWRVKKEIKIKNLILVKT